MKIGDVVRMRASVPWNIRQIYQRHGITPSDLGVVVGCAPGNTLAVVRWFVTGEKTLGVYKSQWEVLDGKQ